LKPTEARDAVNRIEELAGRINRPVRIMEVCGTHTHAIGRGGLRALLPPNIELVSGPGCPVCVTSQRDIERMILLAAKPVTVCTFGDMIRVPGRHSTLEQERSGGADVRVVYSPLDALDLARSDPKRDVVFLAVGFETTTPGVASVILKARKNGLRNFTIYAAHKLIVPAMEAVLDSGAQLDSFITPGHVSVILGAEAYEGLAEKHRLVCVAAGFEPFDIIEAILQLLEYCATGQHGSFVQYQRAIRPGGNARARDIMFSVFQQGDAEWRGIGTIPGSGLIMRDAFSEFDAAKRYELPEVDAPDPPGCRCGDVLKGQLQPAQCPLFGKLCTPRHPLGPCMVSSEGSCAARYKYG
jgi:hydrogenase expression/formation protein HypD